MADTRYQCRRAPGEGSVVSASRRRGATVCPLKLHDPGIAQGLFACVPTASTSAAKAAACAKPAMMMDVLPPQTALRYMPMSLCM